MFVFKRTWQATRWAGWQHADLVGPRGEKSADKVPPSSWEQLMPPSHPLKNGSINSKCEIAAEPQPCLNVNPFIPAAQRCFSTSACFKFKKKGVSQLKILLVCIIPTQLDVAGFRWKKEKQESLQRALEVQTKDFVEQLGEGLKRGE